jgi:hypothetical protein
MTISLPLQYHKLAATEFEILISPLGSSRFVSPDGTINLPKVLNYKHKLAENRKLLKLSKALTSLALSSY